MQPAWEDYKCYMGGRFVTGIQGFKYGATQVKEPIYGEGIDPHDYGRGNREFKCEITVLQSELEAIILSGGDPTNIPPFSIVHSYVRKGTTAIITDVIEGVEFTEWEKGMDQGATHMTVTLPCVCLRVTPNVSAAFVKQRFNANLQ